jgi:hypothetical protein
MRRFLQMLALHPTFSLALLTVLMLDPTWCGPGSTGA